MEKKYDGTWHSLKDKSHRPKSHQKQHTKEEHDLIMRYYHKNKDDKFVLWDKMRKKGISVAMRLCVNIYEEKV